MGTILIMEDDLLQASIYQRALEADGHSVEIASSASEALACVSDRDIELVVTDIFVRNETGLTPNGGILLIGKLRNARFGIDPTLAKHKSTIPIIAITGAGATSYTRIDPLESARDLGADYVLRKPIDLNELCLSVNEALKPRLSDNSPG